MAFFQLVMKACKLEEARVAYHDEKLQSIEMSKGTKPHYTLSQKIRMKKIMLKMLIMKFVKKLICWHENLWCRRMIILLKTNGTFENFLLKSFIGFFGGVLLTYMLFIFFIFQLNFTLFTATMFSSLFGIILTIGLAFSYFIRCIVFLLLPQFFSKRGRQALMAYAFILTFTGPTKNTLHNIEVLSESLTCGQEELKETISTIRDLIKQPFYALRDAIAKVLLTIKEVVKKIENTMLAIKRIVLSILRVIKSVFDWLGSIVSICNKKIGTPFERCEKVFEGAVADCHAKLGPFFGGLCNLTYLVSSLCYLIKKFSSHMKAIFYVKVDFTHSFHFETNQSKSYENVAIDIVKEIKTKAENVNKIFNWMNLIMSVFILFTLFRVLRYHHKWLTSDRYNNKYLTKYFRYIDLMRAKNDKETVLPLNRRERKKYIPLTSCSLIRVERNKLLRSAIFLGLTTLKLCIHISVDYSLYWILDLINYYGRLQTKAPQQANSVGIHVSGSGYLAELYRSITRAFSLDNFNNEIDTLSCLPDPLPPDYDRYTQIAVIIISCWIMAIFEPYGLRLRQVVMGWYYPDRAKQRAVYLYNQIIRLRGNFLKFARRQLRRKYGMTNDDNNIEKVTCKDRLLAFCPKLNICFSQKDKICLLCGSVEKEHSPHIKCPNPTCIGLFCIECFADLQNICTICRTPMEYGDLSDISEEKDSSDDDMETIVGEQGEYLNRIKSKIEHFNNRQRNRDDIFHASLRGGADASMNNFTCNNYQESEFSFLSTYLSSTLESLTQPNEKIAKHSHEIEEQALLLKQKVMTKHQSYYSKSPEKCEQIIHSSTSTEFLSNQQIITISDDSDSDFEMNEYYHRDDNINLINFNCEHGEDVHKNQCITKNPFSHESIECYEINERNQMQLRPLFNVSQTTTTTTTTITTISSDSLEASTNNSVSQLNSYEQSSLSKQLHQDLALITDENNDSQLSTDSSINIDTECSSEKQRRQEVKKWYRKKFEKK
ncbi:hypothetical protein PV328_010144 [Microctonus aethiopoides]|uniref:Dendritic cell-specific transmembrane protein-like domain-containing protein n=1 Tax=Microctonus aethiopoides TaxID=144406 RepID=A0AA39F198_9HYME|nr:hypothetical protein PV328_010144 [Microctonus aethiopoides]